MPHDSFDERLSAYLDGELPPQERDQIDALLREHPELHQAVDEVRQIGQGIRQLPSHSLGEAFADRIVVAAQRAAEESKPQRAPTRRRTWLAAAVSTMIAIAAIVTAVIVLRPRSDNIAGAKSPPLSPAEQAVAAVLAEAQQDGKSVVVRLRLSKDAIRGKVLDQALTAQGISSAPAVASNPAAQETAQAYKSLSGPSQEGADAADVVFIEAEQSKLRKALIAIIADTPDGKLAIASEAVVSSTKPGLHGLAKAEGEGGSSPKGGIPIDQKDYAQHLPSRGFPLLKSCGIEPTANPALTVPQAQGNKPVRILIVVEVVP